MHRVLERQIRRFIGDAPIPPMWQEMLQAVSETYAHSDEDRALLDRSLELSSQEFLENSRQLREAKEKTEEIVKERTRELKHAMGDLQVQKERLEESKAKDEAMLLSIGDGLIATDKEGVIVMVNGAFERLMGWTESEVIGKKMFDVVPREDEAGVRTADEDRSLFQVLHGASVRAPAKNFYYVRKDGTRFPAAGTTTQIRMNETITGAVEVFRDVTKEQELDRAKNEFISLASHQLRTPLSSMKWVLELLVQDKDLTDRQKDKLNDLNISNERLIMLVNSLLNIARMETGKMIANKKSVDISTFVEDSCRMMKPNADKKRQRIVFTVDTAVKEIDADPMLLGEAFNNFLSNAINYGFEGSDIHVSISEVDGHYRVAVHSTGTPISARDRERLFTKFYRGTEARNVVLAGTGLGLYIAKAAVEANGGAVGFDSSEEAGTTFYFTVPIY